MNWKKKLEENFTLTVLGVAVACFAAGFSAHPTIASISGQTSISEAELKELESVRDARLVSAADKAVINQVLSLFDRKAFTEVSYGRENVGLMLKGFDETRIALQQKRALVNNRVYVKILETMESDLNRLLELSPWSREELQNMQEYDHRSIDAMPLFERVREQQQPLMHMREALSRLHKNGILEAA